MVPSKEPQSGCYLVVAGSNFCSVLATISGLLSIRAMFKNRALHVISAESIDVELVSQKL